MSNGAAEFNEYPLNENFNDLDVYDVFHFELCDDLLDSSVNDENVDNCVIECFDNVVHDCTNDDDDNVVHAYTNDDEDKVYDCHNIENDWIAKLKINDQLVSMEVDTGARF